MKSRGVYLVAGAVTLLLAPLLFHGQDVNITPRPKPAPKEDTLPPANIRVTTNLVLIPVTVNDPLNRPVSGLEKENFKVYDDKVLQTISAFAMDDEQMCIRDSLGFVHLVESHVDGIQERGGTFGLRKSELLFDGSGVFGERHDETRPAIELHQEEFIFLIGDFEKLGGCHARTLELVAHTAAGIEDQARGDGFVVPVSYTHLDVYKRQGLDPAA